MSNELREVGLIGCLVLGPPKADEFDLADALDDRNDLVDGHRKPSAGGGGKSGWWKPLAGSGTAWSYPVSLPTAACMPPRPGRVASAATPGDCHRVGSEHYGLGTVHVM